MFLSAIFLTMSVSSEEAMALEKVKIAVAQMQCVDSDLEGNFSRIASLVERADSAGAQIVMFPETVDLGWVNPEAHSLAGPVPGPFSSRICELAGKHSIWIGIGLCEKDGDKLYDSAILIDSQGAIRLKHRKVELLAWLMDPPYSAGDSTKASVVETPFGRVGIIICADSFNDGMLQVLAAARPDLVYVPYGWAAEKKDWPEHSFSLVRTVQRVAHSTGAPVIGPNVVGEITHGPWTGWTYEGLSTAAQAGGLSIYQGRWNREDLTVIEISPGNILDPTR